MNGETKFKRCLKCGADYTDHRCSVCGYEDDVIRTPLKTIRVNKKCECGGILDFTGTTLMCSPPLYVHQCIKCEKIINLNKKYPCLDYEEDK